MAAISTSVLTSVKAGDHIVADEVLYGSTYDLFVDLEKFGVKVSFVDTSDPGSVDKAILANTKLVFLETPANPTMKLTDIKEVPISLMRRDKGNGGQYLHDSLFPAAAFVWR